MRIGDLRFLSGEHHRIFKTGDILKNSVQKIFPCFDPALPHQSGIRAFFKIKCLRLKCYVILLPALQKGLIRQQGCPEGTGHPLLDIFYTIGNFISYRIKTSGGSHCGGKEDVAYATRRRRRIPQAGFFFICIFPASRRVIYQIKISCPVSFQMASIK